MTPDEADQALFTMAAVWPGKIDDATIAVWRNRLQRYEFEHVILAVDQLADTENWWPSWSKITEGAAAAKRAQAPVWKALPPVKPSTEDEVRAAIREARETLREAGAKMSVRSKQRLSGVPWSPPR